jgi:hypothetical protein
MRLLLPLLLGSLAPRGKAALVLVQSLTRHGNRAPNAGITKSCPALYATQADIVRTFGAEPAGLTSMGMNQALGIGSLLRRQYVSSSSSGGGGFIAPQYNPLASQWYFQAAGFSRHQQTAAAVAQGLFPIGTGPPTYPDRLQPVAVSSWDAATDFTLGPPTAPCAAVMAAETAAWKRGTGDRMVREHEALVEALNTACGMPRGYIQNQTNPADTVKNIVDAIIFLFFEDLPAPKALSAAAQRDAVSFAQKILMSSFFGTPTSAAMWLGDFPATLLGRMEAALQALRAPPPPGSAALPLRYAGYVSSRELLFVVGQTLGVVWDVPTLPPTQLPPASTVVFELHDGKDEGGGEGGGEGGEPYVLLRLLVPPMPPRGIADVPRMSPAGRVMKMGACGGVERCPLQRFAAVFARLQLEAGTWREICDAPEGAPWQTNSPPPLDIAGAFPLGNATATSAGLDVASGAAATRSSSANVLGLVMSGFLCIAVGTLIGFRLARRKIAQHLRNDRLRSIPYYGMIIETTPIATNDRGTTPINSGFASSLIGTPTTRPSLTLRNPLNMNTPERIVHSYGSGSPT